MSVVNTGSELPGLTLSNGKGRSQAETLTLALQKNSDAITLLQEGNLLTLAVLLSSYVSSLCALIQSYDVINRMFFLHSREVLQVGTGQVEGLDQMLCAGLASPD